MKYRENAQDTWHDLNIKALDSMEIGSIIAFAGDTIPTGWLVCDGSSITQSAYPELYALIGGTLPNFKGRTLVGKDTAQTEFDTLLETGGSKYIQDHTHQNIELGGNTLSSWSTTGSGGIFDLSSLFQSNQPNNNKVNTGGVNGDEKGNSGNLQPYAVINWIIKATNTTPTMASVVNAHSTSTTDAYSCDYINNELIYSTTAVDTGKQYVNGKHIYRRVISGTTATENTQSSTLIDASLTQPMSINGFVDIGGGSFLPITYSNTGASVFCFIDNGYLKIQVGNSGFAGKSFFAIIEYTK